MTGSHSDGLMIHLPGWHKQDLPGDWRIAFNPAEDAQIAS